MQGCMCLLMSLMLFSAPSVSQTSNLAEITPEVLQELLNLIDSDLYRFNAIELAPTVRLAFHECVSGCDGSVNLSATQNRGLEGVTIRIHNAYESGPNAAYYQNYLTEADFVVLVTSRAVGHGLRAGRARVPHVTSTAHFHYGRPTGPHWSADPTEGEIVDASDNWPAVLAFLGQHLSPVTENELIALMGLHGMGRCETHNSGYNGPWDNDRGVISNDFYRKLLGIGDRDVNFVQVQVPEPNSPAPSQVFPSDPPEFDEIQWERRDN